MDAVFVVLVDGEIEGVFTTATKAGKYIRDSNFDRDAHVSIVQQQVDPVAWPPEEEDEVDLANDDSDNHRSF